MSPEPDTLPGAGLHPAEDGVVPVAAGVRAGAAGQFARRATWARRSRSEPLVSSGVAGRQATPPALLPPKDGVGLNPLETLMMSNPTQGGP